jgi:uncharacterized protein YjiS (DUF1127 family)
MVRVWEELRLVIMEFHMSILFSAPAQPVGFPNIAGFRSAVHGVFQRRALARAKRRQADEVFRELQAYTDRQLHDLGLDRSEIGAVARGTYSRA